MVQSPLSDESKFCISFGNQGPRVWRKSGTESMFLEVQCEVSTVSDELGCHVICWCWSTVFSWSPQSTQPYQEMLERFMLPSADKLYGEADFIFQQDVAPAHTAKGTKSWFNDHGVTVIDWSANSPDLNSIYNLWSIVKRKMRDIRLNNADDLKAAIKATWASITPEQCHKADCLHATPHWCSNSCKRRSNQVLSS